MIKLALVDPDPQFAEEMERLLEGRSDMVITAMAFDLNQALSIAESQRAQVMLFGPGIGSDISIPFIKKLTARYPIGCILLTFNATKRTKLTALLANVVEVVRAPADAGKIIAAVQLAAGYAEQQLYMEEDKTSSERKCTIITIFSTKGGVGKTVLATNIATSIARETAGRVVLVDLDLQFGDVGMAMGLDPDKTMLEFANHMAEADAVKIDDFLITHESGLKVLLAPLEPESADLINGDCVSSMTKALKRYADFIVVDTPASFNDTVLAVLDESDEICIVLTMDILSLKNIKLCLRTLGELKYPHEKQRILINRVESNVGLKIAEMEKVLGMRAIAKIPFDKAVPLSVNKGVPVVIDAPKLPVSREIETLALFYVGRYRSDRADLRIS
ncbi:MAG: AAA family ATPase [Actinobacteria bacterium]|nr:AAA family ATPase [Actinomycetota bacterium]